MLISYSRKELRSVGNYENVTYEIMAQDSVDYENESNEDCYNRLKLFVDANIADAFRTYRRPSTKHVDLEHEKSQNKIEAKSKPKVATGDSLDDIRSNIAILMDMDSNNQYIVADMLKTFEAEKITDLKGSKPEHFNKSLREIIQMQSK
jgi:hypothetical protein